MAIAQKEVVPPPLTYEQYLAEGEINQRYDIIDGVRNYMPGPTRSHQRLLRKVARPFEDYEETHRRGLAFVAPCDVLIRRNPLRTRQPDVLFISNERNAQNAPLMDPTPFDPAPELVVEILSPSDTPAVLNEKIADYGSVGVEECWVVNPAAQTVSVLPLTREGVGTTATYGRGEVVRSIVFPDLTVLVDAIFAEPE